MWSIYNIMTENEDIWLKNDDIKRFEIHILDISRDIYSKKNEKNTKKKLQNFKINSEVDGHFSKTEKIVIQKKKHL